MYIFGYKTTIFIQNLYILVKLFCKNFIFRQKKYNSLVFLLPNVHFWVQNYSFYPKFVHFGENVFWVQNYSFYPKFVYFSEIFWHKLHF